MLLKSTFSLPQSSGFVAFDGGGAADLDVRRPAARPADEVVTPRLEPELEAHAEPSIAMPGEWQGSRTWTPSTGVMVRRVEAAVVIALCGYFAFGLASVAGWL